ncbi:MAG: bifunctional diaminohydroxyphosphoribosylaminopyrimidine deaminase/5-amino-6-(5-phosphoribosylamino)uracil reductase RibD, partial [bacterium]
MDKKYIKRTFILAKKSAGKTNPNPMVGAIVVKDGQVVGEGYHKGPGFAHAEINALNQAKTKARGATLYVNLEPCSHQGRTPPCTKSI